MIEKKGHSSTAENLTILLPGGALPHRLLGKISELADRYAFALYLSTNQNLRLYGITQGEVEPLRKELAALGLSLKQPGKFPLPRVCIGERGCKLGLIDTLAFSNRILARFGRMAEVKPKLKIAIAGCPASCTNAMLADIGLVATRQGFELYVGGKGGARPRVGRRVRRQLSEEEVLESIGRIVEFHNARTVQKQRLCKLVDEPGFPYPDEV